ncbi:CapA family protein [Nguyenibacter vanlangensis]|uniref:CapA family protein n=1 Tax=Nguyenibacter vanlangensis TaxID=1216886 RepID=A0ABZ3D8Q9_9PROT
MSDLTLLLGGDVMLGRGVDQILRHPGQPELHERHVASALGYLDLAERENGPIPRHVAPDYVWGDALPYLRDAGLSARIVNLETAVTTSGAYVPKGINYRMHPDNVDCLTAARIDCCVLANNHTLDWGQAGLMQTLDTLWKAHIQTAGAGRDLAQATAPAVLPLAGGDRRLLVFACALPSSGVPEEWKAGAHMPGLYLLPDLSAGSAELVAQDMQRWRRPGDIVIASIHWGGNWGYLIPQAHRQFAQALIDRGADLIHGHSAHHRLGLECHRGKLILYGCGDLINDYEGIGGYAAFRPDLAALYLPRLGTDGRLAALRVVPMQIRNFRLRTPRQSDITWFHHVLARESAALETSLTPLPSGEFEIR